jgi:HEAT repeat protein
MDLTSGLGILTTNRDLSVRSWNEWLAAATGLSESQAQGRDVLDLVPPDRRELYRDILVEVVAAGTTRVLAPAFHHFFIACPPRVRSAHFSNMQQRVTIAPLRADDAVVGLMITIEDVTAQLDQQRTLATRLEQGEAADAAASALEVLAAEDWRARGAAVRTLRRSASRDEIAHLLSSLQRDHLNLNVMSSALQILIATDRDVTPALVGLLSDTNANLRMHAALALGQIGAAAAAPALVGVLDDEDENVRFHAIEALGRLAVPEAVEPLARIAQSGDFFLAFPAIDALARTDDARVAPSLLGLLDHELLRPAVVDTLAALGDEDAVAPLVGVLNEDPAQAGPVAAALDRIRERYDATFGAGAHIVYLARTVVTPDGVRHLTTAVRTPGSALTPIVAVLGWMGDDAVDALVGLLGEPSVRTQAMESLLAVGRAAVPAVMRSLEDGDRSVRLAAANLLGRLGDRRAVPALMEALTSADADLTTTATAALASLGDAQAFESVLPLFAHEQAVVRQAAIAAVNSIGAGSTAARIGPLLNDPNPHVRECAIRVAGYFGFDDCRTRLLQAVDDPNEDVRRAAIEQLPIMDDPRGTARLVQALGSETPRNRAAAAHAMRGVDGHAPAEALVAALDDSELWVRYYAAASLGARRDVNARHALARTATEDPVGPVRIAAVQALGEVDPDWTLQVAEQLVLDADDDVACGALAAIGSADSERADELLVQAAKSPSGPRRSCAIDVLAGRRTLAGADALAWAARLTDEPELAARATLGLSAVAARADATVRDAAVGALLDLGQDPQRRDDAVSALARLTGDSIHLVAQALSSESVSIRTTAVEALARMRHPQASQALAVALRDSDGSVRAAAVAGFGRLGTTAVADAVAAMRDSDPDPLVRRRAAAVCQRHGWSA